MMTDLCFWWDLKYAFKVITHLDGLEHTADLVYNTKDEQIAILQSVLLANETDAELGTDVKDSFGDLPGTVTSKDFGRAGGRKPTGPAAPKRITGSLSALSGAQAMSYIERWVWFASRSVLKIHAYGALYRNRSENKALAKAAKDKSQPRHALFQKRAKVRVFSTTVFSLEVLTIDLHTHRYKKTKTEKRGELRRTNNSLRQYSNVAKIQYDHATCTKACIYNIENISCLGSMGSFVVHIALLRNETSGAQLEK
jgi:hypothetical protein